MAIQLEFDGAKTVKSPTIVLAKKSGNKLGTIPVTNMVFTDNLNSMNTVDFKVYKTANSIATRLWDEINDFRLIWCKEWDAWFEITVEIDETNELIKNVTGCSIGESELSAIKIFDTEINTENDIARDDYLITTLYNENEPDASLLNRITEKAPHYTIKHVDDTIKNLQRTFTFDNVSIYEAFQQISEEIGCLFILSQSSGSNGYPERGIYVYDLEDCCNNCGYRREYMTVCPECGSTNIHEGYGEDSNVFISTQNLVQEIILTTDTQSVNNCFRLEAGDDLMTAAIMTCNPNGSQYIWYITDESKNDMSSSLVSRLNSYDSLYNYYQNQYVSNINSGLISSYNTLVNKYSVYNPDLVQISNGTGFSSLINNLYNAVDFELYITSSLMPTIYISGSTASAQATLLNSSALSTLAVTNLESASEATVNSNMLSLARSIVSSTFKVEIRASSYDSTNHIWTGSFTVTNYSDETDTANSSTISAIVTDDYESYVEQKINNLLNKSNTDKYDVVSLFKKAIIYSGGSYSGAFVNELKKYSLNPLKSFLSNCQSCLDILIQEGISDDDTWSEASSNLYESLYLPYYYKLQAIENEIASREGEIATVQNMKDAIDSIVGDIQTALNFRNYLGGTLWREFCSYRRETEYSNSNYISDGLTNSQIIENAETFIKRAKEELIKSAMLQHSISTTLSNLLVIPGFELFLDHFSVGNWIRAKINDEVYKLRLISYSVDFDDLENLEVEFSDVIRCGNDLYDLDSILRQANSVSTSYGYVERQAKKNIETRKTVNNWFEDGLDVTLTRIINAAEDQTMTFDSHGLLMRKYDDISGKYDAEQVKMINSTIAITDDKWKTTKTAVGKFYYVNPLTSELCIGFGVNGETIIGKMILGASLAIYNSSGTLTFNDNGFTITNSVNTFKVNPNSAKLFEVLKGNTDILYLDTNGNLSVTGNINASTLSAGGKTSSSTGHNGLFIDSSGNLYSGNNNQVQILANGTFNFGNGKIVYDGTDLNLAVSSLTIGGENAITSSELDTAISNLSDTLVDQIDAKVETWAQSTNPASSWSLTERTGHDGDLWLYTGTSDITVDSLEIHPQGVYQYNASTNTWSAYSSTSSNLFDMIDGKTTIYYGRYFYGYSGYYYSGTSTSSVASPSTYDIFYNTSTDTTYIYRSGSWIVYTNTEGYPNYFDKRYNYVYKWTEHSSYDCFDRITSIVKGDFYYSMNELNIKRYDNSWALYYDVADGDYLVDGDTGATYSWKNSNWVLKTDYKKEIAKYIRFETLYGLMIADLTDGQKSISSITTYNTLINSSSFRVRHGTSVLAEYGSSIKLYKPGTTTVAVEISPTLAKFTGNIIANGGSIGGFNITSTSNTGTSSSGGHIYTNSLYVHSSSSAYEYEVGIHGASGSSVTNQAAIYVKRISSGENWSSATNVFYLTNSGYLYASNANISGAISATSFTAYGSNIHTYTRIGDNISLINTSSLIDPYLYISNTHDTTTTTAKLTTTALTMNGYSMSVASGFVFSGNVNAPNFTMNNNNSFYVSTIPIITHYSNALYFGANGDYDLNVTTSYFRGANVVVHANSGNIILKAASGGAVYLNSTSGDVVTSDETLKDISDIDNRYSDFFDNINPIAYKYKVGHRTHMGFGAQSIEKALLDSGLTTEEFAGILIGETKDMDAEMYGFPDGWIEEHDKLYSLRYEEFIALNTYMIKKLQNEIAELKAQLSAT